MTNGYTKSVDGTSLYPQYRRVTTATWSFPSLDNAFFLQNLADGNRALQGRSASLRRRPTAECSCR